MFLWKGVEKQILLGIKAFYSAKSKVKCSVKWGLVKAPGL